MGKLNCLVTMTTSFPSSLRGIILASKKPLAKILPALAEDAGGHFGHVPALGKIPKTGPEQEQIEAVSTNFLGLSAKKTTSFQEKEVVQMRMREFKITLGS